MATPLISSFEAVRQSLRRKLAGHEELIERLIIAIITGGHVLIDGSPGLAKTRAVNCFAELLEASFVRIQATPDLLPADITGTNIYHQGTGTFNFVEGPLFNNIVLVDEINRAPPKVQSALLEAMGERQITGAGVTRKLDSPFMVVATQNPIEHEGTYPLPEAQLDRFMFFVNVSLPEPHLERRILDLVLAETHSADNLESVAAMLNPELIHQARTAVLDVHISDAIRGYIVRLVTATRGFGQAGSLATDVEHAASPRGSIYLALAAQASAWLQDRDHVLPKDVMHLAPDILSGRLILNYQAQAVGTTGRQLINDILDATAVV